jgi:calcineurin-like phosphoesterase family protein
MPVLDLCDLSRKSKPGIFILTKMKDAYYFPHDSNAKDDPKMILLIEELGMEGYGIFWMLIESLRDQPDYKASLLIVPALARRYNTTQEKVKTVILRYDLFVVEDDTFFYSESLIRRMQALAEKRLKRQLAGKKGGNAKAMLQQSHSNALAVKESKVKQSKEKESIEKENTYLPAFEHVWELYGRKGSKKQAYDEWKKLSQADKDTLLDHVPRYVEANEAEPQYMKDFERYIKHQTFHSAIIERPRRNIFSGSL